MSSRVFPICFDQMERERTWIEKRVWKRFRQKPFHKFGYSYINVRDWIVLSEQQATKRVDEGGRVVEMPYSSGHLLSSKEGGPRQDGVSGR